MFSGMDPIGLEPGAAPEQAKRKRGRPKKNAPEATETTEATATKESSSKTVKYVSGSQGKAVVELAEAEKARQETVSIPVTIVKPEPQEGKHYELNITYHDSREQKPSQKKSERKSAFSVWLDQNTAADVKRYSTISGRKLTDVMEDAIHEYLKNHPLTTEQKERYKQRIQATIDNI